jgi:hypothetical protein
MTAYCNSPQVLRLELLDTLGNVTESLDLMDQANGYRVDQLDIGFPTVRAVTAALPTRDGDYDTTRLFGPRVVTISGSVIPTATAARQAAVSTLAYWSRPRVRPRLVYAVDAAMPPLAIGLRGNQLSAPYTNPTVTAFSVSWVAPDPVAYALAYQTITLGPLGTASGRTYNLTFNRTYPAATGGAGIGTAVNGGDKGAWPRLLIYGPCTNPAVFWVTPPGGAVVFASLTIAAGDYVDVDTFAQTALLNSSPAASRYSTLDFVQTVWAPLEPGTNTLRFAPASFAAPCQCAVIWRDAWI